MSEQWIKFPEMRANLMTAIKFLAKSGENQIVEEYDQEGKLTRYFDFDLAVHILFDDIPDLDVNASDAIGVVLLSESLTQNSDFNLLA